MKVLRKKSRVEQGDGLGVARVRVAFLNRGVRIGLAERVSFEQRYKEAGE